jgi:hypothetical protein
MLMGVVWPLGLGFLKSNIVHVHNDPIVIQRFLLTLFFINNKLKQTSQLSPFFVETAACDVFLAILHHYSCFCVNDITLLYIFH